MKTKFISLEGYHEIGSVSSRQKKQEQLNTTQKMIRFMKRAISLGKKKKFNKKQEAIQIKRIKQNPTYHRHHFESGMAPISNRSTIKNLKYHQYKPVSKTHQHSAPKAYSQHTFVKKKAVLAVAVCLTAVMLSCVTVASALDTPWQATDNSHDPQAAVFPIATTDEALQFDLETPDLYVNTGPSCLYIDGKLIGSTAETEELDAALEQVLLDARAAYDDATTTEFLNVNVERQVFDADKQMTVSELMAKAKGLFSIKLETDWSYEVELDYDSNITYDEEKDSDYEKVTTEGKKGIEQIHTRLTYIDGTFTDAKILDSKIVKKPVTEEITKGCKKSDKQDEKSEKNQESKSSGTFIWPFPHTHGITSVFGWRWGRMHQGIDIAGGNDYGQPIVAADSGKVTWSGNDGGGYGNYVMIDHGNGYMTVYAHGCEVACSTGDYVNQGDTIMYCGSTGNSTGPHLHFEIRVDGTQVDPLGYVS